MTTKSILHVGAGYRNSGANLPVSLQSPEWNEIRLDIDPACEPDIIGSMLDMQAVADASMDAIYSAHNIEHVYAHEVPIVLKEFLRVLKPSGFLVVTCPDLQTVCSLVAENKLTETAYVSPAGPITPLDILYGHRGALAGGRHYMAHKCGFTMDTLVNALLDAEFQSTVGRRRAHCFDLWVLASKSRMLEADILQMGGTLLPQ